ncbi:tRNA (adenosine(37)-N6)-dimethylallyltransferase MiaA [Bacillus sp. SCS-151]|uniref:tRNA (adenosine(37)-N6)-dimethylallyltransferase MiaA n=1 Tax=Nanhaiella sioensis TaxID=3115293 RepID=UPI00397B13EF
MNETEQKVVVIVGPTAVGKTKLSIELAKKLNGEIISGDSMQIYRGMDIGTAKIKREEMEGIEHHLIDIKDPHESFSVAEFQMIVRGLISDIQSRGKLPMIVGGTGLYIQAVLYDYQFSSQPTDLSYRNRLQAKADNGEAHSLYNELKKVDPLSIERIHPHNVRRVIRALEVYHVTGKPMSELQQDQKQDILYDNALIGLTMDRAKLYDRINARVDLMFDQGLVNEAHDLYERGIRNCQSIQAIGYKELYEHFDGKITLADAKDSLKQNSRRYAKRQLTWIRNKMDIEWFDMTDTSHLNEKLTDIFDYIAGKLKL